MILLLEAGAFLVALVATLLLAGHATDGSLAGAALRSGEALRTATDVAAASRQATWEMLGGCLALGLGRVVSARRAGTHVGAPLVLPAVLALVTLGFLVQLGYGDPLRAASWPGPGFGRGVLFGGILGGLLLAVPWDPAALAWRGRHLLLGGAVAVFLALGLVGTGPAGSGTRINLGPVQPIEVVKVAFVVWLGVWLGRRAGKLRFQRERAGFIRMPRPRLLLPAVAALLGLFGCLLLVHDLGPTLILSLVFLVLFYVVTRSAGWVVVAVALTGAMLALLALFPDLVGSETLSLRLRMWTDPWRNGAAGGDQIAAARWALAAGGLWGQGLGHGAIGALPAGHTDLVLAHLGEELGVVGVGVYVAGLVVVGLQGLWIAAWNRTSERMLLAAGLAVLLLSQAVVIGAGTLGVVPLTGVVVPFLSYGKSSMVAFLVLAALLLKVAENGAVRAPTDELKEIQGALRVVAVGTTVLALAGLGLFWGEGVARGDATTLRGVVTTLRDGTVVHRHDPRLEALARRIPRGEIRDRNGQVLVGTDENGHRTHPLGSALGTLVGPDAGDVLRPPWSLERLFDARLRGWPDLPDGPAAWMARGGATGGREQALFVAASRFEDPSDREKAAKEAERRGLDPATIRLLPLPAPDLRPLLTLLRMPWEDRPAALDAVARDRDARAVALTLDGSLQAAVAAAVERALPRGKAVAAVVLDVDTGRVLARAQAPDFDPGDDAWLRRLADGDRSFVGAYGPWSDKTGLRGIFQVGSVFKLVTAIAAVRTGEGISGDGCAVTGDRTFGCLERDAKGPFFTLPGWKEPIHDFAHDPVHGHVDLVKALAVSCNVFFGQLGLALGPEPYRQLVADGLEVGWGRELDPGEAGSRRLASTAFGQGAAAMSVSQAARMVAVVGGGGVYRRCPSTMELAAPCTETRLVDDPSRLGVILAGMRQAVDAGTARGLKKLQGVRIYGKTGTADAVGLVEEAPYGVRPGSTHERPHAWFVALAERGDTAPCDATARGRLAVAVVVARGGTGASAAGPVALEILGAANQLGWFGPAEGR